ncbi:hypothetical protein OG322_36015 [Streptomyces sp. NBC_01260]|uniref:hypothetical protein n=1 Tax=Streptomyces sp. NBC_01260 TaxID=2903801 RepID=UPI002E31F800|nr:hypothetical protein [Streptomyces sp. NBC_01260]
MTEQPAVWSDTDPLMTAIAAAVYEQCASHPERSLTVDDPRNIAAVAATVARQVLGTTTETDTTPAAAEQKPEDHPGAELFAQLRRAGLDPDTAHKRIYAYAAMVLRQDKAIAPEPAPADRAAGLREAVEVAVRAARACGDSETGQYAASIAAGIGRELRRMADEAQQPTPTEAAAHPAEHTWAAELHDPLATEWIPSRRYVTRDRAVADLQHGRAIGPTWKDGTPTQRRLVRATTTYTVEPTPASTEDAPVAAYREPHNPRVLLCREHGEQWRGLVPVTSDDLPDGGTCTFGQLSSLTCGRDVLITPASTEEPAGGMSC